MLVITHCVTLSGPNGQSYKKTQNGRTFGFIVRLRQSLNNVIDRMIVHSFSLPRFKWKKKMKQASTIFLTFNSVQGPVDRVPNR